MARMETMALRKAPLLAGPAPIVALAVVLVLLTVVSFGIGRYSLDPLLVIRVLLTKIADIPVTWSSTDQAVILNIRPPRIFAAILVGAALSTSGAAYQSMFRNPLVSPEVLGVAAGAGFGASIGILLGAPEALLHVMSFGTGLLAAVLAIAISRISGRGSLVVLVLAGVVTGAMFGALISSTQFLADPETTLPEIIFWLFGSLARATLSGLVLPAILIGLCLVALYFVRWQMTVLAIGEDDARTLGVNRRAVWLIVIVTSTLMTATVVSIAGIIGWVGLVVPHLARFIVGPSFSRVLPASALLGAIYLLAVDDVARSVTMLDIPLGIVTALIGAPFFVGLLIKLGREGE